MSQEFSNLAINENLDTLSLILNAQSSHQLKDIIIDTPQVAIDNDYHLLTLACWCSNYDIVDFLIQDYQYLNGALNNSVFYENFKQIAKFDLEIYSSISKKFDSLLLEQELLNTIPPKDFTEIQKH